VPISAYQAFRRQWIECKQCPLHLTRQHVVLARGRVPCDVLFTGEAPGSSEDLIGKPFVGPAGRLLDTIIAQAMPAHLTYALTNVVCCIPLGDDGHKTAEPEPAHIKACRPRLDQFIALCRPKMVVCVGSLAAKWLMPKKETVLPYKVAEILHPSYIIHQSIAQRGLLVQRTTVTLANAVEDL
jgi:uracil-DNA glycosylase